MSASFLYPNGKSASITTHAVVKLPLDAYIVGTKGTIKILEPFWCPETIIVNGKTHEFKLPDVITPCNYVNSSGLRYEAIEVRRCIQNGLLESPHLTWADSESIASIQDELRRQVGVKFSMD